VDEPHFPGYGGTPNANDFEIVFSGVAAAAGEIDTTVNTPLFFDTSTFSPFWSVTVTGPEVIFTAPPGTSLAQLDDYQIVVSFVNANVSGANSGFSAEFTFSSGVPEPST
jgi:hypothetical protein